jgi:formate dehydrogenase major subunit
VPGLGASFGRGGATTNQIDVQHADAVVIMGSTMAECHPVGFRFVMKAKLNGAAILHIDPRFTRTSAMADVYAPLRAGSDVVFLVGLINHVLVHEAYFRGYVVNYTNAACLIHEGYQDSEDLDGLFSGFDAQGRRYDPATWRYDNGVNKGGESTSPPSDKPGDAESLSARVGQISRPPLTDPTLRHPRCVFQILKRHYARYTPELVERVCGTSPETFLKVAEALIRASGPDRTAAPTLAAPGPTSGSRCTWDCGSIRFTHRASSTTIVPSRHFCRTISTRTKMKAGRSRTSRRRLGY